MLSIRRYMLRDVLSLMALSVLGMGGVFWFATDHLRSQQARTRLEERFVHLSRELDEFVSRVDQGGMLLARSTPTSQGLPQPIKDDLRQAFPEIQQALLLTPTRHVLPLWAPTGAAESLRESQKDAFLRAAQDHDSPFWAPADATTPGKDHWAMRLYPTPGNGRPRAVLLVYLSTQALDEGLAPHRSLVRMVDDQGREVPLPSASLHAFPGSLSAGEPTWGEFEQDGILHLMLRRPLHTPGFHLVSALPLDSLDEGYRRFRLLLAMAGGLFVILMYWQVQRLARRLRRPLHQLAEAARDLEEGKLPEPIQTDVREVHRLGASIIQAAQAMHRQMEFERHAAGSQRLELMGSLAGGIAHDVNNHLTAIMGQLGLARDGLSKDHMSYSRLERAEDAALRCSDMIRALLNFSGRTPSEVETLDLNQLVRRSAELFERLLGGRIQLELLLEEHLPNIQGSRVNLEQVLMNLAVNARDAMPDGGTLKIATQILPTGDVGLQISDTGHGIPENHLSQIFDPFFTTKAPEKGSGLGLAMVRSIVEEQKGRIEVASAEGAGTTFALAFPASSSHSVNKETPTQALPKPIHLEGRRILVVDDEPNLRELLCETFLKCRALVASAPNGAIALRMIQEATFDLVITDQRMPEMTGLQLIQEIRRSDPGLPIILASGFHLEGDELTSIGRDPQLRFLAKPFTLITALNAVSNMLRGAELSGRIPPPASLASQ